MQRSFEIIKRRRPFGKWGYELLKKITIKSGFDRMITSHWSVILNLTVPSMKDIVFLNQKTNTEVDRQTEKKKNISGKSL